MFPKKGETSIHNKVRIPSNMPNPQGEDMSNYNINTCNSQDLQSSSISYKDN